MEHLLFKMCAQPSLPGRIVVERLPLRVVASLPPGILLERPLQGLQAQGHQVPLWLQISSGLGLRKTLRLRLVLERRPLRAVCSCLPPRQVLQLL